MIAGLWLDNTAAYTLGVNYCKLGTIENKSPPFLLIAEFIAEMWAVDILDKINTKTNKGK
jgi:hypothetical protein